MDDKQVTEADGDFNLRHVVAEARVAAAQEETIAKQERASSVKTGKQGPAPGPPATKAKSVRAREPNRPVSGSFSTSEFIPPPPVLDREANDTEGSQVRDVTGNVAVDVTLTSIVRHRCRARLVSLPNPP